MIRKHWWKFICAGLLMYAYAAGILVPLGPGLTDVDPHDVYAGQQASIQVKGYNTWFTKDDTALKARLRLNDKQALMPSGISVKDDNTISLLFDFPSRMPIDTAVSKGSMLSAFPLLEVYGPATGKVFLERAVRYHDTLSVPQTEADIQGITPYPDPDKFDFAYVGNLRETIRNLYFHVPMWFGMMVVMLVSFIYSIRYLRNPSDALDHKASGYAQSGVIFGMLGLVTGALWAKYTWGSPWSFDVKQNMAAVAVLMYAAYFVLRGSFDDPVRRARISAVYNIFSFAMLIPLLYVIPRMTASLHPGGQGNPAFNTYDLDSHMRLVFYPACIGWILFGVWMSTLIARYRSIKEQLNNKLSNQ